MTLHARNSTGMILAVLALALALAGAGPVRADDLKDGRAALQAGRYDEALRLFEKAAGTGLAEGRAGVGQVWLRRGQYSKAADAFQTAQKMDPNLAWAYFGQGEVLRRQEQCEEAVPLLQKATDLDRKFPEAQLALSDCLVQIKHYPEAIAAANRGLNWGAKWRPKFLVALGNISMARDSLRDAGIWFTKAREESPEDPIAHRALGDFYVKRGTFELAYPEYQAAIDKDSTDIDLRFARAQALYYGKRYTDALEEYKRIVARDPEMASAQLALGNLLYLAGKADPRQFGDRFQEAKEPLQKYTQLEPTDPRGWSLLGRVEYFLKQRDEAIATMNKAEQLGDKSKEMRTIRARAKVEKKDYDGALADYKAGTPESQDMFYLAQIFVIQKNPAGADSLYSVMIAGDSSSSTAKFALNEKAKMRFREKDYPGTVDLLRRRIALDPNSGEAYYYLGLSYKELKQYPDALAALRQAAVLDSTRADRQFWLGIMYAQMDSTAQAREVLQRSVDMDTTQSANKALALRQLAYYQLQGKAWSDAIQKLELSVQINSKDVQALVWLGQAYQNSGNQDKACDAYRRALAIDPAQAEALKGRKSLGCA